MRQPERLPRHADDVRNEFTRAVQPHLARLSRLVATQAPPTLVEDVTQDVLLRAFRSWHRFEPGQPVWPWLARVAERACATAWKADFRWRRNNGTHAAVPQGEVGPGSDQHVAAIHARSVVRETLTTLGNRDRVLLYRCDAEGMPRHALAETVALAPGTVRVALLRARRRFRRFAADRWDDMGVAAGFLVTRLRLRPSQGAPVYGWAIPTSVLVAVVASVASHSGHPDAARAAPAASSGNGAGAVAVPPASTGVAPSNDAASFSGPVARVEHEDRSRAPVVRGPDAPSPPSGPALVPAARTDIGPDGLHGGLRVDYTLPINNGHVEASPSVRCRHSLVTEAFCKAAGSAPSTGPAEFYGSGNGDP
jgi:RNA polymerase sigma-70 factor (ECF subfamily)